MSSLDSQALVNQRIHYANCKRMITVCAGLKGSAIPISDLEAGRLVVDGRAVVSTLETAHDFLTPLGTYNPDYLTGLQSAAKAIDADTNIAAQIGTGGPNPWNAPFDDVLTSIQNWTNNFCNPYNEPDFPSLM